MRKPFPKTGTDWTQLRARMQEMAAQDVDWRRGRAALYVFDPGADVLQVQREAYQSFMVENGLGTRAFPSLKRMEDEVVEFGLSLLNAPDGAGGTMASGGTESILMAMKTARDRARKLRGPAAARRIVAPASAHPAFEKAAHLMGVEVHRSALQNDLMPDLIAMKAAITPDTFMLVGSAPSFSFGLIEPIAELGRLAQEHDLWLHVDSCVGGYFAPFVEMNGEALPLFDFRVPGVASMSADLHKFGYAAKGASTFLYRDAAWREFQVFASNVWPSGALETPTLAGTRPGGAIAAAWAVMNFLGVDGYRAKARIVVETRRRMAQGVCDLGFTLNGDPKLMIFTFGSDEVDPIKVGEALYARGWYSGRTQAPRGIHMMISPGQAAIVEEWLAALAEAKREASASAKAADAIRYA